MGVNGLYRARLRTIAARHLWDGRRAAPGRVPIPGMAEFQKGVRALRAAATAGSPAAGHLAEIDAAMDAAQGALGRWRRVLAAFAAESVPVRKRNGRREAWLAATRLVAVRAPQTRRLARLIVDYDALCAATVAATANARQAGVFNPHHASIGACGRRLRTLVHAAHAGRAVLGRGARRREVRGGRTGPARPR